MTDVDKSAERRTGTERNTLPKTIQLRIYTVRPDRLDEWIDKFHRLIVPLRRTLGFDIEGSWVDRERSQHIWFISYSGEATFEQANADYWASPERDKLGIDPNEFLLGEETRVVERVS
jgi:hypothetical protein